VTPAFISRSSIIIFSLVVGVPLSTSAETVKVTDKASTDGSFSIAQTQGMNRRGDRRDTRQDCRQQEGAVGADKRNCKQQRRQTRGSKATQALGTIASGSHCRQYQQWLPGRTLSDDDLDAAILRFAHTRTGWHQQVGVAETLDGDGICWHAIAY
jgi:hypothetical protein